MIASQLCATHGPRAQSLTTPVDVRVSPSHQQLRRADPSLSFQVNAPGARFFDVIVATDPVLFDPANAHRRTPKNFRSSRQDFQGEAIEIEIGFYMLPRAFLRDVISVEPRPTRLYYLAVAYADHAAHDGRYSVSPDQLASNAPYVSLMADLNTASLSRVLGVAVERLGAVNASGRVMAQSSTPQATQLPEAIGGLPLIPRRVAPHAPAAPPTPTVPHEQAPAVRVAPPTPQPAPPPANGQPPAAAGPIGTGQPARNGAPVGNGQPLRSPVSAHPDGPRQHQAPASPTPGPVPTSPPPNGAGGAEFIDEDYAYGAPQPRDSASAFRDLDVGATPAEVPYDDGFGPLDATGSPPPQATSPIPPLDPAPEPPAAAPETAQHADPTPAPAAGQPAAAPAEPPTGAAPKPQPTAADSQPAVPAQDPQYHDAVLQSIIAEGAGRRYEALNLDGAFRGRMGPHHPYYQRAHEGLSFGPGQVTQDSGELGELLTLMQAADPATFEQVFGPDAAQLVDITTRTGPPSGDSPEGRSARVQPVAGNDLWEEPWITRFRAAATHPPFQSAMRAQLIARRVEPILPVAQALGLEGRRGIAMLSALSIFLGVETAVTTMRAAINPFDTPARIAAALEALGYTEIGAFRQASGLPPGDQLDAPAHFALIAALRGLGTESPVQIPDDEAMMDLLVTGVGPGAVGDALLRLRVSTTIGPNGAAE